MSKDNEFLYPHQKIALTKMFNGCILNGGTGSGKSRAGIYYYFSKNGGKIEDRKYTPMRPNPPDLLIISTAKKRNDMEWEQELIPFHMYPDKETHKTEYYGNRVFIDSWQNIKKYENIRNAQIIFDEDKITGNGVWVKAFLKMAKHNEWIVLSATPGDKWEDYIAVFVANGFYRNRTEFKEEHMIINWYRDYPQVTGYRNETRLIRLRDKILIDMDFDRHTIPHHEDVHCRYNIPMYRDAIRTRTNPFSKGYVPTKECDPDALLVGFDIDLRKVSPILPGWFYEPKNGDYVKLVSEPIAQASGLCYVLRKIVNSDESRQTALLELFERHPRMIVFYSFDYERDILLNLAYGDDVVVAEYSGHAHQPIPDTDKWVYVVNYSAGAEGFNCIKTNCIVFYSQTYSYKVLTQACGRIDRLNTPYTDLYYYHFKTKSGIDLAISRALTCKKKFNERKFTKWDK